MLEVERVEIEVQESTSDSLLPVGCPSLISPGSAYQRHLRMTRRSFPARAACFELGGKLKAS